MKTKNFSEYKHKSIDLYIVTRFFLGELKKLGLYFIINMFTYFWYLYIKRNQENKITEINYCKTSCRDN